MNAVIRGAKGALAVAALVGVGLGLRWMTDGAITGMRTYDLESMTVLLVGTVAWMAYGWFVLAVLMTVLEQIPGAIGALAGAVVGRITSKTARTLLRSGLGVAAVTPLTVGAAHATPTDSSTAHVRTQSEPLSTVQLPNTTTWRTTEPGSTVHIAAPAPNAHPQAASSGSTNQRATEPGSQIHLGQAATGYQPKAAPAPATRPEAASSGTTAWRATEPGSQVQLGEAATGGKPEAAPASRPHAASLRPTDQRATHPQAASSGTTARRATEPGSRVHLGQATTGNQPKAAPAPGTHRQAAPADTADWRASEPPSTVRLTEQTPGAGPTQYVGRTDAPNPHTTPPTSERPAATEDAQPDNGVATPAPTGAGKRDGIPTSQPTADARRQDGVPTSQPTADARRQDGAPTSQPTAEPRRQDAVPTAEPAAEPRRQDGVPASQPTAGARRQDAVPTAEPVAEPRRQDGVPASEPTSDGRRHDGVPTSQPTAEPRRRDGGRVRVGVPDRPAVGAATRYTDLRSGVPVRVPGSVVVKAGDSLWSLAAAELGPGASAEAVAARWPEWYAANRQVIGSDPDLILPGQVLRIPAAGTGRRVPPTQQEH